MEGKTVTEGFSTPTALRKAHREVAEFHRFQPLSAELIGVSQNICQLRPDEPAQTRAELGSMITPFEMVDASMSPDATREYATFEMWNSSRRTGGDDGERLAVPGG